MAVLEFDNLNRDEDVDEDDEWVHYQNEKKKPKKNIEIDCNGVKPLHKRNTKRSILKHSHKRCNDDDNHRTNRGAAIRAKEARVSGKTQ